MYLSSCEDVELCPFGTYRGGDRADAPAGAWRESVLPRPHLKTPQGTQIMACLFEASKHWHLSRIGYDYVFLSNVFARPITSL